MSEPEVLGVLGGMGPRATVNFVETLIDETPAETDQEHIPTIVYNDPTIPDRNAAILDGAESPLPKLRTIARNLEAQGVDAIAIPCNTAHHYYDALTASVDVEILNMVQAVRETVESAGVSSVGILGTTTVLEAGIYRDYFADSTVELIAPEAREAVMDVIYAIKEGEHDSAQTTFESIIADFERQSVDSLIIACTDLSVLDVPDSTTTYDSSRILAIECVSRFGRDGRESQEA
ncbi:aspartate/glutamate racemase family protein [Halovivax limisalsi]|uniref:aspartate/glutamate racemase family protein n=1 Tax=Halovivax limisalsi TaxID=1453760 RepID=UPI001FFC824A|nr:amino acid racemase [Halovivax limisalsi]